MRRYAQLTQEQRYQIHAFKKAGFDQTQIAREVGVHKSTICRELRRNRGLNGYRPLQAHVFAVSRRKARSNNRITTDDWKLISILIRLDWSPEQNRRLSDSGTTIFLTTHYLEEADVLSNRLAIMDHGLIVAEGTSRELKQEIAADSVVVSFNPSEACSEASEVCGEASGLLRHESYVSDISSEGDQLRLYVDDGVAALPKLLRLLEGKGITVRTITLSEPTLDDVFLRHTGRSLRDAGQPQSNGEAE